MITLTLVILAVIYLAWMIISYFYNDNTLDDYQFEEEIVEEEPSLSVNYHTSTTSVNSPYIPCSGVYFPLGVDNVKNDR